MSLWRPRLLPRSTAVSQGSFQFIRGKKKITKGQLLRATQPRGVIDGNSDLDLKVLDRRIELIKEETSRMRSVLKASKETTTAYAHESEHQIKLNKAATKPEVLQLEEAVSHKNTAISEALPRLEEAFEAEPKRARDYPAAILARMNENESTSLFVKRKHLSAQLVTLNQNGGLEGIPTKDVEIFLSIMDGKEYAPYVKKLERMVMALPEVTQPMYDALMAGYAARGLVKDVQRLITLSPAPGVYAFGNLTRSFFVAKKFAGANSVLELMASKNVEPNLEILTTVIQANMATGDYKLADQIFTNMQYMSSKTRPDAQLYATMILLAGKQRNTNRAFDLYNDMISDPRGPIKPTLAVVKALVFTCARDPDARNRAWHLLANWKDSSAANTMEILPYLLYLCGQSGELMIARALVQHMATSAPQLVNSFALNSLFGAYLRYDPKRRTQFLSSQLHDLLNYRQFNDLAEQASSSLPPFLPSQEMTPGLILAETEALMRFYEEQNPSAMYRSSNLPFDQSNECIPATIKHIRLAATFGDLNAFKDRYNKYSFEESVGAETLARDDQSPTVEIVNPNMEPRNKLAIKRDSQVYLMALNAAVQFRNIFFARDVWEERGRYRRCSSFQNLPKHEKHRLDFLFAKRMIDALTVGGDPNDAVEVINSSYKLFCWRHRDIERALQAADKRGDFTLVDRLRRAVKKSYEHHNPLAASPKIELPPNLGLKPKFMRDLER